MQQHIHIYRYQDYTYTLNVLHDIFYVAYFSESKVTASRCYEICDFSEKISAKLIIGGFILFFRTEIEQKQHLNFALL